MIKFRNYRNLKIDPLTKQIVINSNANSAGNNYPELLTLSHAIQLRDTLILFYLSELGVGALFDLGCDFGSLISKALDSGLEAEGCDVDSEALQLCKESNLPVFELDMFAPETATVLKGKFPGKRKAVSCLNVLHSQNIKKTEVLDFLKRYLEDWDYVIFSCTSRRLKWLLRNHNFAVIHIIGDLSRPITRLRSHVSQYGRTFF